MKLRRESTYVQTSYEEMQETPDFSQVSNFEDRIALQGAFSVLSDEERQIILLHANTGMKHREIAAIMKLPLSTVLSKYRRGLKKLRNYMEGEASDERSRK